MNFSMLMSVYQHDDAQFFEQALQSILACRVMPTEFILVCDGHLNAELNQVIINYQNKSPITVIRLSDNVGLGRALQVGLKRCQYEWVARFDADDICCKDRFRRQITFLQQHPGIDVLGGQVIEFSRSPKEATVVKKLVPSKHKDIEQYAKSRNPVNHMTVMFRKSSVLEVGSYQHAPLYEDYDLWIRMLLNGCKFANIDTVLVYARAGQSMYERRGGLSYAKQEVKMQMKFYKLGFISLSQLTKNLMIRVPVRVMPNTLREKIYLNVLRR